MPVKQTNTGRLFSVYCPDCNKVTQKVSWNLLREAGAVKAACPVCGGYTLISYNGKTAELYSCTAEDDKILRDIAKDIAKQRTEGREQ
jgi:ribosomal protein S27E